MTRTSEAPETRIDSIMNKAGKALVERRYFDAERLCLEALDAAHLIRDYERMARICLPLQEARRHKRDQAADAGEVFVIDGDLPKPAKLRPGCYLVRPPRVGLDGRMLRESLDARDVPAIVLVREPTTRAGQWPVVALGPVTIRTYVPPPPPTPRKPKRASAGTGAPAAVAGAGGMGDDPVPTVSWFLAASEALGDAAIASIDPARSVLARVEDLIERLYAFPDHEKLHQALLAACEAAARLPERERKSEVRERATSTVAESEDDEDLESI